MKPKAKQIKKKILNKKLIPSIKPMLEKIKETNFYVSKELENEALGLAKE